MAEWTVEMRATYRLVVTVEADTEDDARERALAFDSQKFDVALYRDAAGNARAASAVILSLMSERDEANARALNWECRFEAASARGAAAEARIRELSLSELTALGQADENHKRALDAEARLEKAKEALRGLVTANEDWNAALLDDNPSK